MARDRLLVARVALEAGSTAGAISAAYYAMLYAARAALSEQDAYAKTHAGTWNLFRERFVLGGVFDHALAGAAERSQKLREAADYDAVAGTPDEAAEMIALAERFVASVGAMLGE